MEKGVKLTLQDVGDAAFRVLQRYLFRSDADVGAEVSITSSELQESIFVKLVDATTLLIKIYPHKNFMAQAVFRIEIYRTKLGDLRGNRVAFVETPKGNDAVSEIKMFLEGVLGQLSI